MSSPFKLSAAIEAARARMSGLRAGSGPPPEASSSPRVRFQSPPSSMAASRGRELGVLGEFQAGGVVPVDGSYSVFEMTEVIMSSLCLGDVAGRKFCTLGITTCSIRKHAKKVPVVLGHFYIAGPRNRAFADVHLDPSNLTAEQRQSLLSEQCSLIEWQRLFGALQVYEGELSPDAFATLKQRALAPIVGGITPRKRKERYASESDDEEDGNLPASPFDDIMEEGDPMLILMAKIDRVLGMVKLLSDGTKRLKGEVGDDVDRLETLVQDVTLRIGQDPGLADSPLLSAWEGIAYFSSLVGDVQKGMAEKTAVEEDLAREVGKVRAETTRQIGEIQTTQKDILELLNIVTGEQRLMYDAFQERTTAGLELGASAVAEGMAELRHECDSLRSRIRLIEMQGQAVGVSSHSSSEGPSSVAQMGSELRGLQERFGVLEARVASVPVTFGGRVFLSLPDVMTYVSNHIPSNVYYLFHDSVSLLECLNTRHVDRADVLQEIYQAKKVGLAGEIEARMIASFRLTLPAVFCGSQTNATPGAAGRHLPAIKNFAGWNSHDNSSGVKQFIERGLNDLRITVKYDIDTVLGTHAEAKSLANDMHGASHTFISELSSWVDAFYQELVTTSETSAEDAWDLTANCVKRVFEELRRVRAMAANANGEPDAIKRCAKYLWATLQAHQVMQDYVGRGFRDHQSIFPVINYHLFRSSVTKSTFDKHKQALQKLEVRCNQIDSLQGKVAKLERKGGGDKGPP